MKIVVEGRGRGGEVVRYGTLESEGVGVRVTVEPNGEAEQWMAFVVQHKGGPVELEPLTPEWLRALPRALSGSRLWCRRG